MSHSSLLFIHTFFAAKLIKIKAEYYIFLLHHTYYNLNKFVGNIIFAITFFVNLYHVKKLFVI